MSDLPSSNCPRCGYQFDRCTGVLDETHVPKNGDVSLCMRCGTVLIFTADLHQRLANETDLQQLSDDQLALLLRAQRAIHYAHSVKN